MTDALPHLLLYLAGIETPTYKEEYNILSPKYNEMRPRILKIQPTTTSCATSIWKR